MNLAVDRTTIPERKPCYSVHFQMTIFLCFWSDGAPKTELRTRKIGRRTPFSVFSFCCDQCRVSSGIPCYGIPPEFCGIFSRNSAGIKLRNSVFFTEFRIYAEFRILWNSAMRNSVYMEFRNIRNSVIRNSVFRRYGIFTEFRRNSVFRIMKSVKKKFRRNFFGRNNGHSNSDAMLPSPLSNTILNYS